MFSDVTRTITHRCRHAVIPTTQRHQRSEWFRHANYGYSYFLVLYKDKSRSTFLLSPQVFYYSTSLFTSSGLTDESAKFATMGIGAIMVGMTLVSLPLMDRTGRRTLHLYGLGGMFIFSIFITISFLIKVCHIKLWLVKLLPFKTKKERLVCVFLSFFNIK